VSWSFILHSSSCDIRSPRPITKLAERRTAKEINNVTGTKQLIHASRDTKAERRCRDGRPHRPIAGDAVQELAPDTVGMTEIAVNVVVGEERLCQMIRTRELLNFTNRQRTLIERPPCTMGRVTT